MKNRYIYALFLLVCVFTLTSHAHPSEEKQEAGVVATYAANPRNGFESNISDIKAIFANQAERAPAAEVKTDKAKANLNYNAADPNLAETEQSPQAYAVEIDREANNVISKIEEAHSQVDQASESPH